MLTEPRSALSAATAGVPPVVNPEDPKCAFCLAQALHGEHGWRCTAKCERTQTLWRPTDVRPIIYLGGAKTACADSGLGWRQSAADRWAWAARFSIPHIVPTHNEGPAHPHLVVRHDLALVRNADAYLWDASLHSVGTAMEAFYAARETSVWLVFVEGTGRKLSPWERWFFERSDDHFVEDPSRKTFHAKSIDEGIAWIVAEAPNAMHPSKAGGA